MRYLTVDDVVHINESLVGPDCLVDFGLLESAVLRPQTTVMGQDAYPSIHAKGSALFHSLVRTHAFLDGNKRTAVLALIVFYGMNGMWLEAEQNDVVGIALDVAEGLLGTEQIESRLKNWATAEELPDEDFEA